jgi:hypothetical protein
MIPVLPKMFKNTSRGSCEYIIGSIMGLSERMFLNILNKLKGMDVPKYIR